MARLMKDSGIPWIGEIPDNWETPKVLQCLQMPITDGPHTTPEFFDEGIPFISAEAVSSGNGRISFEHKRGYISREFYNECCQKYVPQIDDVYMIKSGATTGRVAIVDTDQVFTIWSPLAVFRADPKKILPFFLFYSLQADYFQKQIENAWSFGTQQNIGMRVLEKIRLCLPPVCIQTRIVNFLDAECARIDAIIEQTRATVEEYKKLKQSIITQAVTKGIRPNRPMKDSGIEWIGEIPDDWLLTKVKYVSSLVTDGAHVSPETENGVYDFVSTVNIDGNKIDFDNCLKTSISSYNYLVSTGCKPQIGDVLISKDGTVGKTVIVNEERDFVVASSLVIIRPKQEMISSEYLNYFLQSKTVQDTLLLLIHGAGLKRVSVAKNANLTLLLPDKEEQHEIVNYLNDKCKAIDLLILKKEQYLLELDSLKKALIYEYVTGKKEAC